MSNILLVSYSKSGNTYYGLDVLGACFEEQNG